MVPSRLMATSGCVLTRPKLAEQAGVSRQAFCHFFKDNDVQVTTPLTIMKVRQIGLLTLQGGVQTDTAQCWQLSQRPDTKPISCDVGSAAAAAGHPENEQPVNVRSAGHRAAQRTHWLPAQACAVRPARDVALDGRRGMPGSAGYCKPAILSISFLQPIRSSLIRCATWA